MLDKFIFSYILVICLIGFTKSYELTKSRVFVERKYLKPIENTTIGSNRTSKSEYFYWSKRLIYIYIINIISVYFPIFEMIEFPNEGCLTVDGLMGTCYARTECDLFRGITRGFCARGFGVCCFCEFTFILMIFYFNFIKYQTFDF